MSSEAGWTKMKDPYSTLGNGGSVVQINSNEFMMATDFTDTGNNTDNEKIPGLYVFNIVKNYWRLWMKYPDDWRVAGHTLLFDKNNNSLYLWHASHYDGEHKITQIDMKTKQFTCFTSPKRYEIAAIDTKDEIHMIGGWNSIQHIKFDKTTQKFQEIHRFDSFQRMYGTLIVHIPSRDVLLIFGGSTGMNERECHIREFCLKTSKWRRIENIDYPYYIGQALLTMNEKHILLTPLYDADSNKCDCIMILDILDDGNYKLRQSKLTLPTEIHFESVPSRYMVLTGCGGDDKILVSGFVRNVFKENDLVLPSDDIINLIAMFYDSELLHLVRCAYGLDKRDHHVISLSSVLN